RINACLLLGGLTSLLSSRSSEWVRRQGRSAPSHRGATRGSLLSLPSPRNLDPSGGRAHRHDATNFRDLTCDAVTSGGLLGGGAGRMMVLTAHKGEEGPTHDDRCQRCAGR